MNIPKYWAKSVQSAQTIQGKTVQFTAWQWSDTSPEDARYKAESRARQLAQKLLSGQALNRYFYGERPPREEILDRIVNGAGKEIALITRNAYGAQVLNAANAMFIDIDFPDSANTTPRRGLFRKPSPVVSHEEAAVQKVRLWAAGRPDLGIRVYRTFGGLRCLVTSHLFHPADRDALAILQALESDPLYIRLCQAQACFRARLTAKPWRMGIKPPPFGCVYPWETPSAETTFRGWEKTYQQSSQQYAACHYLVHLGPGSVHPEIEPILKWHDNTACSRQNLPLA